MSICEALAKITGFLVGGRAATPQFETKIMRFVVAPTQKVLWVWSYAYIKSLEPA